MSVFIDYILPILGIIAVIYIDITIFTPFFNELSSEREKEHDRILTESILKLLKEG